MSTATYQMPGILYFHESSDSRSPILGSLKSPSKESSIQQEMLDRVRLSKDQETKWARLSKYKEMDGITEYGREHLHPKDALKILWIEITDFLGTTANTTTSTSPTNNDQSSLTELELYSEQIKSFICRKQNLIDVSSTNIFKELNVPNDIVSKSLDYLLYRGTGFCEFYCNWQLKILQKTYPNQDIDTKTKADIKSYIDMKKKEYFTMNPIAVPRLSAIQMPIVLREKIIKGIQDEFHVNLRTAHEIFDEKIFRSNYLRKL
jgi:hypothetical protein